MARPSIRQTALGVLLLHDHALFSEERAPSTGVQSDGLLRPLGGAVEHGESAEQAVVRELEEETGLVTEIWGTLGIFEDRWNYLGAPTHDVAHVFVMRFPAERTPLDLPAIAAHDEGFAQATRWLPLAEVLAGVHPLVPQGLPARLALWVNQL